MTDEAPAAWDGVPLNPERDGWHWLCHRDGSSDPWQWEADLGGPGLGGWLEEGGDGAPSSFERSFTYLGPCLTPSEVAAREAAAAGRFQRTIRAVRQQADATARQVEGMAKRIQHHRRIITRLLSMRHDRKAREAAARQAGRDEAATKAREMETAQREQLARWSAEPTRGPIVSSYIERYDLRANTYRHVADFIAALPPVPRADALAEHTQRAVAAETERCAKIAEERDEDGYAVWPDGYDIAAAIRSGAQPAQGGDDGR